MTGWLAIVVAISHVGLMVWPPVEAGAGLPILGTTVGLLPTQAWWVSTPGTSAVEYWSGLDAVAGLALAVLAVFVVRGVLRDPTPAAPTGWVRGIGVACGVALALSAALPWWSAPGPGPRPRSGARPGPLTREGGPFGSGAGQVEGPTRRGGPAVPSRDRGHRTLTRRGGGVAEDRNVVRILQVAPPWFAVPPSGYGGIEWVVASLSDGLADAGHDVTLFAAGGSQTRATLETIYDQPPSLHIGNPWYEAPHALAAYRASSDYDVIHDHTGTIGPVIAASMRDRPPVVNTLHGSWTDANERVYRMICDDVALAAISDDQASRAPEGVRVADVVYNGVELARYPYRADKEDFLLFVGRASADKGPEVAIEVARRVGLPLVMAIKINEPIEVEYYETIMAPALRGADVDLRTAVGHDEKVDLMGRARAVLVPIRWDEPVGEVMAEAGACGTPVVAYRRGAAPEIIVDGETGELVEPGDLGAFVRAVEQVGDIDPRACRDRVEAEFSAARMVERYVALYERLAR